MHVCRSDDMYIATLAFARDNIGVIDINFIY